MNHPTGHRIADLLIKHMLNELTDSENKELQMWAAGNRPLFEELTGKRIIEEFAQDYDSKQRVLSMLKDRLPIPKNKSRVLAMHMRKWWVAALICILVGTSLVIAVIRVASNRPQKIIASNEKPTNNILSGKNRATLTLAGGSTIILDSVQDGRISEEHGASIEKTADGKLAYKSVPNSSPAKTDPEVVYNTLTIPRGGQYFIELSDGSKVWVNAASTLRFPVRFTGKARIIQLKGEAYFEVAKDTKKPFIVDVLPAYRGAATAQIQVFGTHFDVSAYPDDPDIKTTLLEGSVKVIAKDSGAEEEESRMLSPGQQAQIIINNNDKRKALTVIDYEYADETISWKNGTTSFKNSNIRSIMREISRWYDVDVVYDGDIPERAFMGGISRKSDLSEVLKVLELSKIHFEVQGRKIIVKP